jgi:hypothetical protein
LEERKRGEDRARSIGVELPSPGERCILGREPSSCAPSWKSDPKEREIMSGFRGRE